MEGQQLDIDGVSTYVIDRGEGPTVVLLHGAAVGVDAYITWFRTIDALANDYRVIAFDQVGFGRTDLPADGKYKDRLERVDHALSVLAHLNIRNACLVGHSEGAFMAARIAIVAPEFAERLVIVTSGGTAPYLGGDNDEEWIAASVAAYNDPHKMDSEAAFVRGNGHLSRNPDPEYETILIENYHRALATGQDKLFTTLRSSDIDYHRYGDLQKEHVLPFVGELTIPTLLVWADGDATVPVSRGLKLLDMMPSAEFHLFRDSAHNVMHDQAEKFEILLHGFLDPMRLNKP
tara:strand:+ start:209 stop:1078 length:870 start_codon:yes stop_codon:yes gene_type:complete